MKHYFLFIITLLLVASCGARSVHKFKTDETVKLKIDSTHNHVESIVQSKDVLTKLNTTNIKDVISWSYEAPNDTIRDVKPVWIKIGKDSIDLSSLPKGSKLHFTNDKSIKTKDSTSIDKTITDENSNTEIKLNKDINRTKTTKESDIHRGSTNWVLAIVCFLVGWFAIPIIKSIFKKITLWQNYHKEV